MTPEGGDGDEYEAMLASATPMGGAMMSSPTTSRSSCIRQVRRANPRAWQLTQANIIAHTVNAHEGFEFDEGDKNMVVYAAVPRRRLVLRAIRNPRRLPECDDPRGQRCFPGRRNPQGRQQDFLVPAVLAKVLESGEDAVKLFGSLKTFAYGASPMPLPLLRKALEASPDTDFMQAYGLTELCGVISHLLPEAHRDPGKEERLSSAGTLVPNAEVRVVDPDTLEDVPEGEQGELWFRSPQLMKGYHNKPEATEESITEDGWFRTGDIGRVDDGGYIFVEDRLKDMIISGGRTFTRSRWNGCSPSIPRSSTSRSSAFPTTSGARWVKAVVQLDGEVAEAELIAFAKERLAAYKCPKSVDVAR